MRISYWPALPNDRPLYAGDSRFSTAMRATRALAVPAKEKQSAAKSAKGVARTTVALRNCFAPHSVLREFLTRPVRTIRINNLGLVIFRFSLSSVLATLFCQ